MFEEMTTYSTPTTPPIAVLAAYYGAPCTYERDMSTFEDDEQWLPATGKVDIDMLLDLQSGTIRNVQLQLRSKDSITEDEYRELYRLSRGEKFRSAPVFKGDKRRRASIEMTTAEYLDGIYMSELECITWSVPALNYLRSIFIDIDGLGVA